MTKNKQDTAKELYQTWIPAMSTASLRWRKQYNIAQWTGLESRNTFVMASITFSQSVPISGDLSCSVMLRRVNEWLCKEESGNVLDFSFRAKLSNALIKSQSALHPSAATRDKLVEPEIILVPEAAKHPQRWSTKPLVLAWSRICFNISIALGGPETENAFIAEVTWFKMTATQAIDS